MQETILTNITSAAPDAPPKDVYENGSSRTHIDERYDLVLADFVRQMAITMGRGFSIHDSTERPNYQKGGPAFVRATANHLEKHLWRYKTGKGLPEEDDLIAVACNAMILWWHEKVAGNTYRDKSEVPIDRPRVENPPDPRKETGSPPKMALQPPHSQSFLTARDG